MNAHELAMPSSKSKQASSMSVGAKASAASQLVQKSFTEKVEQQQRLLDIIKHLTHEKIQSMMTLPELHELVHCDFHIDDDMRQAMK